MYIKFIFTLVILVLFLGGIFTVAATGLWQVPIISDLLRTDKPIDLGIASDYSFLEGWMNKYALTLLGTPGDCLTACKISYSNVGEMRVEMSSEELSSYLNNLYAQGLPVSNIQVKLGDGNSAQASAWVDLTDFGYDISAPVYLSGTVRLVDSDTVDINIDSAKLGLLPLPNKYYSQAATELEKIFTNEASAISGYSLESVDITDEQLNISGQLPHTIKVE